MAYRYEIEYWTYEQACELPFGLPKLVLLADTETLDDVVTQEDDTYRPAGWAGGGKERMETQEKLRTLREHAATADLYAARADAKFYRGEEDSTFLGEHADYWRGAAAAYRIVADLVGDEDR